jgi:MYND finger
MGELSEIQADFASRVEEFRKDSEDEDSAKKAAAQELASLTWGPTAVPIYNLLGLSSMISPHQRPQHLSIARWLVSVAKVPVGATDASGTTALAHSISTHPSFDPELAQILYDAGGDVNLRNRYGATPGHAMCMVLSLDERDLWRTEKALAWFVAHGGNVDVKDSDACSPRMAAGITAKRFASKGGNKLLMILEKEDNRRGRRRDICCMFCGREDVKLLQCGRCKEAKYCESTLRLCHKSDWPRHKLGCNAA